MRCSVSGTTRFEGGTDEGVPNRRPKADGEGGGLIAHLVLVTPRSTLTPSDRRACVEAFKRAVGEIPTVRSVRVGRRVTHGAGYETAAPELAFLAIIEFEDLEGLTAYLGHPAHDQLGRAFKEMLAAALIYDFDLMVDLDLLDFL